MKPVYQTIISPTEGNCFSCCLATILELELSEVPNFRKMAYDAGYDNGGMEQFYMPWLYQRGLAYLNVFGEPRPAMHCFDWFRVFGVPFICSVPSQKFEGRWHAVIGRIDSCDDNKSAKFSVIHDPNRNNAPYNVDDTLLKIRSVGFIVPIQYSKLVSSKSRHENA